MSRVRDIAIGVAAATIGASAVYAATYEPPKPLEHVRCVWVVNVELVTQ